MASPTVDSTSALADLRAQIVHDLSGRGYSSWFWPRWNGVSGFEGTAPIVFVGLNPSMGHFPSRADQLFYRHLAANGLPDAHLTDALKCKARNIDVPLILADDALVALHKQWLLDEIQIIQPRLIVALGLTDTYSLLRGWLPGDHRLRPIPQHSWAFRYRKEARFTDAMADIKRTFVATER